MYDQAESLRHQLTSNKGQAKTIAFASGKGGVGKSNIALNFAIELQQRKKSVLLFDLDVGMGNIDILLGSKSKYSIMNLFTDFLPIHGIIELGPRNLSYIAGGTNLHELVHLDNERLDYFFSQYSELARIYDYIIFDLGAGITSTTLSFILAADECFMITTPEPTAITDAYSVVKQIVLHDKQFPIHLVVNRCQSKKEGKQSVQRFKKVVATFLETDMLQGSLLPNDRTVTTAVMKQIPYVLLNPQAPISKGLKNIVTEFLDHNNAPNQLKSISFVEKLKQYLGVQRK